MGEVEQAGSRIRAEILRLRAGEPRSGAWPDVCDDPRYNVEVRRRLQALPAWGDLPDAPSVARGRAGDREQGTEVAFAVRIERNRVAEARFRAFGCPHVLAAASWVAEAALGLDCDQLAAWDWLEAASVLGVPPAKFGRLLTLQDAIRAVVRNWPSTTGSTV